MPNNATTAAASPIAPTKDLKQLLQPARGTQDFMPHQARRMRFIEEAALRVFKAYGYGEIRTPIFEFTDLFSRNVGTETDIVTKEMYTFGDRGGESLTLRPEGTAPVARAYYTHGLKQQLPLKFCYVGAPMFRYERPQKGRYRQHHQIGAEFFGIAGPMAEVEMLSMMMTILKTLGINEGLYVALNSLGDEADRTRYREALLDYLKPKKTQLSAESQERLERNPLRVLDSKSEIDQQIVAAAPKPADYLGPESAAHFKGVQEGLDALGIPWKLVPNMVRGIDYYSHTVFEVHSAGLGAQSQVLSGGRYNGLIGQIGGQDVPALGFGGGIERLEALLPALPEEGGPLFIAAIGQQQVRLQGLKLAEELRAMGHNVAISLEESNFKSQLKRADKLGAHWVLILGEEELAQGKVSLKNMQTGIQTSLPLTGAVQAVGVTIKG